MTTVTLWGPSQKAHAKRLIDEAPAGCTVAIKEPSRTREQEKKFHAMVGDIVRQVEWHGNRLTKDEWKIVLTAGLHRQKVVPGIEGGFVAIGRSTSAMGVTEYTDLIGFAEWFGATQGVVWSEPTAKDTAA